jgi:Lipoprotein LpqB beta-propeller domain/Sporulation and spore germination
MSRGARRAAARLPRFWRAGAGGRVATAAVAVAVAAGGCATVPTSGAVRQFGGAAQAGVGQEQNFPQPIPVGPGPGWTASEIVAGFLAASASFADNHAVAREYLAPAAQRAWRPSWAVTVVSTWTVSPVNYRRQFAASQPGGYARVVVTGLRVATLNNTGQSLVTTGSLKQSFSLREINGQLRIEQPPSQLLLTQADFQQVYQPRNLYFLATSGRTLVPDPVFVPQQDTNTDLATGLVNALLQNPKGWLSGGAVTGFPAESHLIGQQVRINGPNAIVNLGGKAATASRRQQEQMAAQLAWTLASGPTAIQSVELEINGRPLQIRGNQVQLLDTYHAWVPSQPGGSSLYFIGSSRVSSSRIVRALSGVGPPSTGQPGNVAAVPGAAGTARVPSLRSIAVSPDGRSIAGISAGGTVVYVGDLSRNAPMRQEWRSESGSCTSLSWDRQGDLWITAGGSVWMLPPGSTNGAVPVSPPAGDAVTAFRVAPDGVRAVMIVHGTFGTQVQLAAIAHSGGSASIGQTVTIGAGITDPQALSWYDANDVIVLARISSGSQLEDVPLNGSLPTAIATEGNITSVTATSPDIAIGLSGGQIMVSANLGAFANTPATGQAPVYPG